MTDIQAEREQDVEEVLLSDTSCQLPVKERPWQKNFTTEFSGPTWWTFLEPQNEREMFRQDTSHQTHIRTQYELILTLSLDVWLSDVVLLWASPPPVLLSFTWSISISADSVSSFSEIPSVSLWSSVSFTLFFFESVAFFFKCCLSGFSVVSSCRDTLSTLNWSHEETNTRCFLN